MGGLNPRPFPSFVCRDGMEICFASRNAASSIYGGFHAGLGYKHITHQFKKSYIEGMKVKSNE